MSFDLSSVFERFESSLNGILEVDEGKKAQSGILRLGEYS